MKKVRATKENLLKLFKERRRIYANQWKATRDTDPQSANGYFNQVFAMDVVISCMTDSKDFNDYYRIFFPGE